MRKKGAVLDCRADREAEIIKAWFDARGRMPEACNMDVARAVVSSGAPRFWVSEERAATVVADLEAGRDSLQGMRPSKRRMYQEIQRRVSAERAKRPGAPLCHLVSAVIYEPAPEHYMEPYTAMDIVYRALRA